MTVVDIFTLHFIHSFISHFYIHHSFFPNVFSDDKDVLAKWMVERLLMIIITHIHIFVKIYILVVKHVIIAFIQSFEREETIGTPYCLQKLAYPGSSNDDSVTTILCYKKSKEMMIKRKIIIITRCGMKYRLFLAWKETPMHMNLPCIIATYNPLLSQEGFNAFYYS